MAFFTSAVGVMQTLVTALGAGLGVWGIVNLLEGYGNDNGGIFDMVQNLSNTVVLPIAGVVLTFVMTLELIQMVTDRNSMHDDVCCKRCISNASNTTYSQLICGRMI